MISSSAKSNLLTKDISNENIYNEDNTKEMFRLLLDKVINIEMKLNTIEFDMSILKDIKSSHDKEEKIAVDNNITSNSINADGTNNDQVKQLILVDNMDVSKMQQEEINLVIKVYNQIKSIDCLAKNSTSRPPRKGKYKHPVEILNNMNLTYEKLLADAAMCLRRLNRKYTVAELRDGGYIGVFARQTLSAELKKIFESVYPNSKWQIVSNFKKGVDLVWKCNVPNCEFRLNHKYKFNSPFLVFKADRIVHNSHSNESF